jgi:hypothetical protein
MSDLDQILHRLADAGEQIILRIKEEQALLRRRQLEQDEAIRLAQWQSLQPVIADALQELNPTSYTEPHSDFRKDCREFTVTIEPFGVSVQAQFSCTHQWALERFDATWQRDPWMTLQVRSLPLAIALARRVAEGQA